VCLLKPRGHRIPRRNRRGNLHRESLGGVFFIRQRCLEAGNTRRRVLPGSLELCSEVRGAGLSILKRRVELCHLGPRRLQRLERRHGAPQPRGLSEHLGADARNLLPTLPRRQQRRRALLVRERPPERSHGASQPRELGEHLGAHLL